jgi:glycosyltransferase involved in cell wall biosynthesis
MTMGQKKLSLVKWVVSMHGSYENNSGIHHLSSVIFQYVNGVTYLTDRNLHILESQPKKVNPALIKKKIYNCLGDWQLNKASENYSVNIESNIFTFGLISRGDFRKGWIEAIDSVIKLNEDGHECRLILAGDGPDKLRIEDMYKGVKCILFLGYVNNPIQLISHFDVGLLPSYFESLPYTIIEYLKGKKPIVATDVGEIKQMIIDKEFPCGQLVSVTEKGVSK